MAEIELRALAEKAAAAYGALSPSQKLRHNYMQRRSFALGMCPSAKDYGQHCDDVDKVMPHEAELTDTEIGLILAGARP